MIGGRFEIQATTAKEKGVTTSNEEIVRAAYRTADGDVLDLEGWRNGFTEDGVLNNVAAGETYAVKGSPTW